MSMQSFRQAGHAKRLAVGSFVVAALATTSAHGALTALYELDGTSGDVADSAGDNPGTVAGSPTRGTEGVFGNAFDFSGGDNGVNLGTDAAVQPTGSFTNTFWLNVNTSDDSVRYDRFVGALSNNEAGNKDGYRAFFNGDRTSEGVGPKLALVAFSDGNRVSSASNPEEINPETGTWYFVANRLEVGGDTSTTVVEQMAGDASASDFAPENPKSGAVGLNYHSETRLAQAPGGGNSLDGSLDDVAFFDSALSNEELATVYNNGAAAIPEPASLALLGLGGLTLLTRTRRSRG